MKIKVKGQSLSITDKYLTVSDTENVYEVEFEFDDAWDGFSKTACFKKDGGTTYSVVLDSTLKCRIPNEVVADSGYIYFGVLGTKTVGTETMRYPTIWTDRMFVDVACASGSTPTPPTPSVYAQILSAYEATNDRVDEVEEDIEALDTRLDTAESDIDDLESGVAELEEDKQDTLVSGTNIKTINGSSILGAGNIVIGGAVDSVNGKTGVVVLDAEDVGALPEDTPLFSGDYNDLSNKPTIPTKTSQLQNDSGFLTQHQSLSAYRTASAQDLIDLGITNDIDAIEAKIPTQASSSNQLADKAFVNSSIATNTATFRGTSASGLTEAQFLAWANTLTHDDNDYVFWNTTDSDGNVIYKRYKYNGTEWLFEYALNNSSFTSAQWNAINSGITSDKVAEITANTNARHTHSNSSVLNAITQAFVDAWNTASTWVSTNGANVVSHLSNTIVHITSEERTAWNAKADESDIPTKTSDLTNDSGFIDNTYHDASKQNETDISLNTTSKQIVGAINEVKSTADGKIAKVANATANNIPQLDASGELTNGLPTTNAQGIPIVTSISSASTNSQVPSAKAVYDEINEEYELIEEITLTEDVANVIRTQDTNGKAYNFKAMIMDIHATPTAVANKFIEFHSGSNRSTNMTAWYTNATDDRYTIAFMNFSNGAGAVCACGGSKYDNYRTYTTIGNLIVGNAITECRFSGGLSAGTVIKLYGVWAD